MLKMAVLLALRRLPGWPEDDSSFSQMFRPQGVKRWTGMESVGGHAFFPERFGFLRIIDRNELAAFVRLGQRKLPLR